MHKIGVVMRRFMCGNSLNKTLGVFGQHSGFAVTVTEPSARLRPVDVRGEWVTQLMKSILGLIALDRVTRTQCSMAIGPLVEIRS